VQSFAKLTNELVPMDDFWYHGLNCAIAARLLARHRRLAHVETLFVAGLLHDVGQLVLYNGCRRRRARHWIWPPPTRTRSKTTRPSGGYTASITPGSAVCCSNAGTWRR